MKIFIAIIFATLFTTGFTCKAQNTSGELAFCNFPAKELTLADIQRFTETNCSELKYTDAEGNQLEIKEYVLAIMPSDGGNGYFEQINGKMVTAESKARLKKAKAGDRIIITNIKAIETNGTKTELKGKDFTILH